MSINYTPNFSTTRRNPKKIKYIIFHYTGMRSENKAINRLLNVKSKVSCHYFIKKNGQVIFMIPAFLEAWHAGKSKWKDYTSLNKNSIGIEISNPGHKFDYKNFSKKQINSLSRLSKFLIKEHNIKPENILGHSDIATSRKKDPGEKFPWEYLSKKKIGLWHDIKNKILISNRGHKIDNISYNSFLDNLFKIGYSKKIPKNITQQRHQIFTIRAFQRRYRQGLVNGKADRECLLISQNLTKYTR